MGTPPSVKSAAAAAAGRAAERDDALDDVGEEEEEGLDEDTDNEHQGDRTHRVKRSNASFSASVAAKSLEQTKTYWL